MSVWNALLDVVILLGVGLLLGVVFERLKQSAIMGYLLTGVLLGPHAFDVITSDREVAALAEIGVALLLFAIGLEFSWPRLRRLGSATLVAGISQVVVTCVLGALLAGWFGLSGPAAVVVGSLVALSSTASVLRILAVRGQFESSYGRFALAILLVQDMAVVPLVLLVSVLAEGGSVGSTLLDLGKVLGYGALLVGALWVVFHVLAPRLLQSSPLHTNRELPVLLAVVSGIGSAVASHLIGVSPALGAFLAGLMLAESPFAVQIRSDVAALRTLLMTLFFTAIGMFADPAWIADNALLVLGVLVLVIAGKAALVWGVLAVLRVSAATGLATGLCLAQIGEFSFVLAEIAETQLLDEHTYLLVISVTVLSMFLTPTLAGQAPRLAALVLRRRRVVVDRGAELTEQGHVVVVGFGPAALAASEYIAETGARLVVIEMNAVSVRAAAGLGHRTVSGDARHRYVLEHASVKSADSVLVTIPDPTAATHVIRIVRQLAPQATVIARCRFHRHLADLQSAGAHAVVDEEQRVGRGLAAAWRVFTAPQRAAQTKADEPG